MEPEAAKLIFSETEVDGITVVRHDTFTSGIGYLKVLFDTSRVPVQDLPYVGLLKAVLGYVDTARPYSYGDLSSEIFLNSGSVSFSVTAFPDLEKRRLYRTVCGQRPRCFMKNWTLALRS